MARVSEVVETTRFDLNSDALARDPWPVLRELREQSPAVWHEDYKRWFITTDRAVRKALVDFGRFTVEETSTEKLFGSGAFIAIDDRKRHDQLRKVWADAFVKQGLDLLYPTIERMVDRLVGPLIERIVDGEKVDLSHTLCRPLPTMVISLMMGVPEEAIADVVRWSDAMVSSGAAFVLGEAGKNAHEVRESAKDALADFLNILVDERRRVPGQDLISQIVHSEPARHLPAEHIIQNLRQLLFAGNETTAKWLAQLFVTFGERSDVRSEVVRDRSLVPAANDEIMRWQTVVGVLVRRVRGDGVVLAGIELADGDDVTLLLGAANRDPARYTDPDILDIHRPRQPNLGFGVGFHNCLGSMLAKVEAEVAMNRFFDHVPSYVIAEPYTYSSMTLRGPMPVTVALRG